MVERITNKWANWNTKARAYCLCTQEERDSVAGIIDQDIVDCFEYLGKEYCLLFLNKFSDTARILKKFCEEYRSTLDPINLCKKKLQDILKLSRIPENTPDIIDAGFYYTFRDNEIVSLKHTVGFRQIDMLWFFWIAEETGLREFKIIQDYDRKTFTMKDLEYLLFNNELSYESIFRIYCGFDEYNRRIFDEEEVNPRMKKILDTLGFGRVFYFKFNQERLEAEMNYVENTLLKIFKPRFEGVNTDFSDLYIKLGLGLKDKDKRLIQEKEDMEYDLSLLCPSRFGYNPLIKYNPNHLI